MQRKSSARQKAVIDPQRAGAAPPGGRGVREIKVQPLSTRGSPGGETTLGGVVDRGLTLAALYDLGVLERLRLEVRIRLIADLTQSLSWLHANPRLMAAHPHLIVTPSTIVIGLDGVARVDVRAAKKKDSGRNPEEVEYLAPELMGANATADLRADVYSVGVLTWEALAGKRINDPDVWSPPPFSTTFGDGSGSDLPPALGGSREREPLHRKVRPAAKPSHSRLRIPPPLTLPEGGEWATPLAELALQAMSAEPGDRPEDCRSLIRELELVASRLATTHEIAEVVQGISTVETLCIPEPTLPDVDAACQSETDGRLGFMDRQPCSGLAVETCAQRLAPVVHRVAPPAAPAAPATVPPLPAVREPQGEALSATAERLRKMGYGSSNRVWFAAGLVCLALLSCLAGYAVSLLTR
jgi:hypothetical protein